MKSLILSRLVMLLAVAVLGVSFVHAADLGAVKARMEQRLAAVDALKDRKAVGENNAGYLEARSALGAPEQKTVSDENADRREVYAAIAAQQQISVDQVGKARAQKIAAASKRGVWLQGADGAWHEKS